MNNVVVNVVKASAVAVALLATAGCQSSKALDEVRALAQGADQKATAAQTSANSAAAAATNANNTATAAKSTADAAQSTANQALQAAQTAQAGVDEVNDKIDRMFKKSVSK
jgi:methyl-accepting chemotaxis protein